MPKSKAKEDYDSEFWRQRRLVDADLDEAAAENCIPDYTPHRPRYHDWDDPNVGRYFVSIGKDFLIGWIGRVTARRNDVYYVRTENTFAFVFLGFHAPDLIQGQTPFKREHFEVDDARGWRFFDTVEERDRFVNSVGSDGDVRDFRS